MYGSCSETDMNRIQTIQNQLLKRILNLDRRTPTNTLHRNMCNEIFLDYYALKPNSYDLRAKGQLKVPRTRLVLGDKFVKIKGALLWNPMEKSM